MWTVGGQGSGEAGSEARWVLGADWVQPLLLPAERWWVGAGGYQPTGLLTAEEGLGKLAGTLLVAREAGAVVA